MSNSKIGMFLDSEVGMGIWTRHVSDDGKVYYYNMKRNESRWAYEFQEKEQQYIESINDVQDALLHIQEEEEDREDGEGQTSTQQIEQMVMKAAMMEREKRIQEVKQERGKKKEIDPTLLQYQQQVKEYTV